MNVIGDYCGIVTLLTVNYTGENVGDSNSFVIYTEISTCVFYSI